ncbi:MAG: DNA repair protein RadC [Candidatus Aminicenantes bacterium]|nr:DNA repair protein RadC [Candidatus Aminicenantes bacterium]NIM80633.1 DNA repair protein RadC [Candidatus Aminicenantes bacterium]NIN20014.1 DNA repair protein RadC [Candidatus Aminicenantes bacterium]NIN47992.1 DNA repair protein RadC [Candidatus Aminicenantes bacterium]NIN89338.1 DNA repair protein RadC [Candidatus Aminicenantes bacterium]
MARHIKKYSKQTINDIPEFDRPREKMMAKGPESLSTLELMAVLVGSGNKSIDVYTTARDLAQLVEKEFDGLSLEKLQKINGVGKVKACQIIAAIEFSRRFLLYDGIPIKNDTDILPLVEELRDKKQEYFLTFTLDGGHHLIEKRTVFIGTLNQSLIHPREIFADAITDRAAAVIFVHNHTATDVYPSKEDILVTKRLLEVAEVMGIEVLDHIIVNKTDSFSFKNKGLLDSKF